jgi:hypothetical protein
MLPQFTIYDISNGRLANPEAGSEFTLRPKTSGVHDFYCGSGFVGKSGPVMVCSMRESAFDAGVSHIVGLCARDYVCGVTTRRVVAGVESFRNREISIPKEKRRSVRQEVFGLDSDAPVANAIGCKRPHYAFFTSVRNRVFEPLKIRYSGRLWSGHRRSSKALVWAGSRYQAVARLMILAPRSFFRTSFPCLSRFRELDLGWRCA